ncbi:TauD/TfdA dioxygenase family protein [Bradyrhizobium uaiense]|uniref:TauD/TfdA family dioxygenase n=1 Tax=Bradyrhizobium uaiense TaxID=2594946 RepID=A0A6P1BKX4_9BRAD|nr:TauD/TfdA family dioxygenase [Bradyrhizobium uaiense]NEU98222.1 TauD/TfdA family dioxygenase [Bradyrhizobium uaiense]
MSSNVVADNIIPRADIVRHAERLGAEIKNVVLSDRLPDELIRAIKRLLLEHKVIFFRDQGHLDDPQQQRFAVRLGSLIPHPIMLDTQEESTIPERLPDRLYRYVRQLNDDDAFNAGGPKISVLRGAAIPPFDGDIAWSSTAAAYLDLPDPLRMLADNLWAVRCAAFGYPAAEGVTENDKRRLGDVSTGTIYETTHPIVCVHPETGERMLSLGGSVQNFVGLQRYPSQRLFELLQSYLTAPKNTLRWNWKSGDVAIWDSRATERYRINEIGSPHLAMDWPAIDVGLPHMGRLKSRAPEAA